MEIESKVNIFKPYLSGAPAYVGGKSKSEIRTEAEKIYKLSSNENALGSSPKAMAAIEANIHRLHEYPERTDASLRKALWEFYDRRLTENHFMATPSGSEMIDLLIRAFTGEGLECIASNPAFQPYFMFAKNHGATTIDVPLIGKNFELDVDGILRAVTDQTRLVFITSPNNPTGTYVPKNRLAYLLDGLPDHVIVVLDEVYYQFAEAEDYSIAMPFVESGKQIIGLNSFSKAYGLAGLRLGYAYGPEHIMTYVRQLYKPFLINTLSSEAMKAALGDEAFIAKTTQHILAERQRIEGAFKKMGIEYWPSQGNFIMLKPDMSPLDFEAFMLSRGIMVRPVDGFGSPGCVRVTIGTSEANNVFLAAMEELSKKLV